jgi:hypothetical protein
MGFAPVSYGIINRQEADRDRLKFIVQEISKARKQCEWILRQCENEDT